MAKSPISQKQLRVKWLIMGGCGTVLLGLGVSCAIESGFLKHNGALWWQWALAGTGSLSLLISGVVILIKAAFKERQLKN
jgi:hypothetical protein